MKKNPLEWAVFGVSTAAILIVIGILAFSALQGSSRAPELVITLGEPVFKELEGDGVYSVPVEVRNVGDRTASNVIVEVKLAAPDGEEQVTIQFDLVPYHSARLGTAVFQNSPETGSLAASVLSYHEP